MDDSKLQEQFIAEITALEKSGAGMPFVFTPSEAFTLLSLLQLALRHPGVDGDSSAAGKFAFELATNIEGRLCKSPALKEIARRGWDPQYDGTM